MKNFSISKIFVCLLLTLFVFKVKAQNPIGDANAELRKLFANTFPAVSNTRSFL